MDVKSEIIYIHPAVRTYRVGIFKLLSKKLNINFFFSQDMSKSNKHISKEVDEILQNTSINYIQAKELRFLPFNEFSFDLLKLPFSSYKVFIFSSITSVPYLLLAPFLKILGKKIILFDELWRYPIEVKKYKIIYPYIRFLSKFCLDSVVTAGSKAKEFYVDELNFDKNKIFVAYNTTVDKNNFIKKTNIINDKKKILYLGRIVKYKGLDLLIKAMKNISQEYDLLVVGDGEFEHECKELVDSLNLDKRVHFMGGCSSDDVHKYYANSDIFVLPTRFKLDDNVQIESWGFTVNEAMSYELPVVTTTAVGSGFDLIIDGETGCLAKAGDIDSLSEKINYIIKSNEDNKIGKKAKEYLEKICNYEDNYIAYKQAIKKALDE